MPLVDGSTRDAELVVDLSDEPVLGPRERLLLGLAGARARAAVRRAPTSASIRRPSTTFELPSLAVIGTGKRIGKTAVAGARRPLLARDRDVVVVAMGRGGPAGAGGDRAPADARRPRRPLARRAPRRVRLSRDGRARRRADGRLPARRRRARGGGVRLERRSRAPAPRLRSSPICSSSTASGASIPPIAADARDPRRARATTSTRTGSTPTACSSPTSWSTRAALTEPRVARSRTSRSSLPSCGCARRAARRAGVGGLHGRPGADVSHLDADVVHVSPHLADRDLLRAELARARGRHLPRRGEGGGDRRRRRGRARARRRGRARRERRRRRGAGRACSSSCPRRCAHEPAAARDGSARERAATEHAAAARRDEPGSRTRAG